MRFVLAVLRAESRPGVVSVWSSEIGSAVIASNLKPYAQTFGLETLDTR